MFTIKKIIADVIRSKLFITMSATFLSLLMLSSSLSAIGQTTPLVANWSYSNGLSTGGDFSSQTVIGPSNLNQLYVKWLFPIPAAPLQFTGNDGVIVTPIVVHGVAYFITNWHRVYALDLRDGKTLWFKDLPIPANYTLTYPAWGNAPNLKGHYHGTSLAYTESPQVFGGEPLMWVAASDFTVFALDALTGDIKAQIPLLQPHYQGTIPGNYGNYSVITPGLVFDPARGRMIVGLPSSSRQDSARGFMLGYDVTSNPPKQLWRSFLMPPQDGSDPNWSINSVNSMQHAWIFNGTGAVDLKALTTSQLKSVLFNDWGTCGFNGKFSACGVGISWGGSWVVDSQTGIAYIATNQPTPFASPDRPGPDLWSDSVLAYNMTSGNVIWGFQATAHDLWDWDCSWAQSLGTVTINGVQTKAVFKTCKDGYLYALDAGTGRLLWYFTPPQQDEPRCAKYCQLYNPLNQTQMKLAWANAPNTGPFVLSPSSSGMFESDLTYDPVMQRIFVVAWTSPSVQKYLGPNAPGVPRGSNNGYTSAGLTPYQGATNQTVYSIDATNGKVLWKYFIPNLGYRGGTTASNGVLYVPELDGNIREFSEQSGTLLGSFYVGAATVTSPAIGSDSNGNVAIVFPSAGQATSKANFETFNSVPGFIMALGLSAPSGQTTTSVFTSVSITTVPGTPTGIDPTTFYAVAGVAAIFVIATGVLAIRRRKPVG